MTALDNLQTIIDIRNREITELKELKDIAVSQIDVFQTAWNESKDEIAELKEIVRITANTLKRRNRLISENDKEIAKLKEEAVELKFAIEMFKHVDNKLKADAIEEMLSAVPWSSEYYGKLSRSEIKEYAAKKRGE